MKIFVPPIEIKENEGFTPENDIFKRLKFGQSLLSLIENTDDKLVIALDAPWGEGKTTFIKQWQGLLKNSERQLNSIYFDAFENDYHQNGFLALSRHIYQSINSKDKTAANSFKESALPVLKSIGASGLKIAIRAATLGALDETILDGAGTAEEITGNIDKYLDTELTSLEADKAHLINFQNQLKQLGEDTNSKKLIFIIDELDRCKPKFALELLENIKHLFSVPNLVFLLVINRDQIEESIRCEYGQGVEATNYLKKFINLWLSFPNNIDNYRSNKKIYINNCIHKMGGEFHHRSEPLAINTFAELSEHFNLSLREIEKSLTNYAVIYNSFGKSIDNQYKLLIPYLSIIKTKYPSIFKKLSNNNITYNDLLIETSLDSLSSTSHQNITEKHPLKWLLKFHLASESEKEMMKTDSNKPTFHGLEYSLNIFNDIFEVSNTFELS